MDVQEILKICTSPRRGQDFLTWFPDKSGWFTVRSAYRLVTVHTHTGLGASCAAPGGHRPVWRRVWEAKVPLKMRILAWKYVSGALATNGCKKYRHISTRDTCPLCGTEKETSFHALVSCVHARQVWTEMRQVWDLPDQELMQDSGNEWLLNILLN